jgi:hypothetical protein
MINGELEMTLYDMPQQFASQPGGANSLNVQSAYGHRADGLGWSVAPGLGQAAFGQQAYGPLGMGAWGSTQPFAGQTAWAMQPTLGQQRQLSPQDVNEVARQLAIIISQSQMQGQPQPLAAFGYGYGPYGQPQRLLSQNDITDVVRQILPMLPQIVGALQGYAPQGLGSGPFGQAFYGQNPQAQFAMNPFGQTGWAQTGWPAIQSAFGASPNPIGMHQQRQLTPHDVNDVARHLSWMLPQAMGATQPYAQQRAAFA